VRCFCLIPQIFVQPPRHHLRGDGTTTFALPDMQSRVPVGQGQGPALSSYAEGQAGGAETVTLTATQMPGHTHPVKASSSAADSAQPGAARWPALPPTSTPLRPTPAPS